VASKRFLPIALLGPGLIWEKRFGQSLKIKKSPGLSLNEDGSFEPSNGVEKRPDSVLLNKELEERVKQALDKVPEDQRAILIFREVEGLSYG
jgi:DNA-directed RNA polymerase specialized sigma24 family protein